MADIDWTLLARYAAGECTAEERVEVEQWLAAAPAHAAQLTAMREVAALGDRTNSLEERTQTLAEVRRKVAKATTGVRHPSALSPRRYVQRALRIAAVLVAALGVSLLGYQLLRDQPTSTATDTPSSFRTFTTPRAGRLSLRLPDGTLADLAPATTLRVPATYGTRDRTLELVGEAVFTVTHDASRPFTVHTARLITRDLGTRFVVREYPEDATADVVVAEGTVAVMRDSSAAPHALDSVVLGRGERVRATADGRLTLARNVALDSYFSWTEGRLVFRGALLSEAAVQLARWYDIDVRLASPELASLQLNASFEHTETAPDVLRVIADALNLDLVRADRVYTLRAK